MLTLLRLACVFCLSIAVIAARAADSAGTPPNASRDVGAQKERDWVDNRWSRTDVGQFLSSVIETPSGGVAKGISIKVGEQDEGAVCFDAATCAWRAAWTGEFLKFDAARFGLMRAPKIEGQVMFSLPAATGWLGASNRYTGLHLNGKRVVLEYTVGAMRVLESPWLERCGDERLFTRSLELGPSTSPVRVALANVNEGGAALGVWPDRARGVWQQGTNLTVVSLAGTQVELAEEKGRLIATFPAHAKTVRAKISCWSGDTNAFARMNEHHNHDHHDAPSAEDLTTLAKPGPARWMPELKTTGQRGLDTDFLAVDTLTVPYDNPWKALMFLAGVDFTPDGAAYVCSIHGDVWRVTGVDGALRELRWKRFATGLHQPLGLKVRDGKVFVLDRDQITRLHDLNGDGEADFYENFCNLINTSRGGHDYVTCLEQDDAGNFYYIDPRGVHRVSADGARIETIASGWRNPNGMGVSPDGKIITAAPQQGEWTPSSQIAEARPGGYYGYGGPKITTERPLGYDAPLCWIPHGIDNSSGSQVWVPRGAWGPLADHMIHLLWGRCGMLLVLRDTVGGVSQGAVVPLPGKFLSGPNRGMFNARDGHLYIAGSSGWQTSAARDGALQRVRFTGKPVQLPVAWHAHSNGLALTFSAPLDPAAAGDAGSFGVKQWNYRYAKRYGSEDWSVANPDKQGRDEVEVKSARLLPDGKTVFLEIPSLRPVMQMEVKYSLNTADGKPLRSQLWLTLNTLDRAR